MRNTNLGTSQNNNAWPRSCVIGAALLLTACGGGGNGGGSNVIVINPAVPPTIPGWQWQASAGVSNPGDVASFQFTFPAADGAHYLVKPHSGPVTQITMNYAIETTGNPVLVAYNAGAPEPGTPMVTLYFQVAGDTGLGQFGRWWAACARGPLTAGHYTLTGAIADGGCWSSVYGQKGDANIGQLNADASSIGTVGMTFGGTFFGHGVSASGGTVVFKMNNFTVQ